MLPTNGVTPINPATPLPAGINPPIRITPVAAMPIDTSSAQLRLAGEQLLNLLVTQGGLAALMESPTETSALSSEAQALLHATQLPVLQLGDPEKMAADLLRLMTAPATAQATLENLPGAEPAQTQSPTTNPPPGSPTNTPAEAGQTPPPSANSTSAQSNVQDAAAGQAPAQPAILKTDIGYAAGPGYTSSDRLPAVDTPAKNTGQAMPEQSLARPTPQAPNYFPERQLLEAEAAYAGLLPKTEQAAPAGTTSGPPATPGTTPPPGQTASAQSATTTPAPAGGNAPQQPAPNAGLLLPQGFQMLFGHAPTAGAQVRMPLDPAAVPTPAANPPPATAQANAGANANASFSQAAAPQANTANPAASANPTAPQPNALPANPQNQSLGPDRTGAGAGPGQAGNFPLSPEAAVTVTARSARFGMEEPSAGKAPEAQPPTRTTVREEAAASLAELRAKAQDGIRTMTPSPVARFLARGIEDLHAGPTAAFDGTAPARNQNLTLPTSAPTPGTEAVPANLLNPTQAAPANLSQRPPLFEGTFVIASSPLSYAHLTVREEEEQKSGKRGAPDAAKRVYDVALDLHTPHAGLVKVRLVLVGNALTGSLTFKTASWADEANNQLPQLESALTSRAEIRKPLLSVHSESPEG